MNSGYCCVMGFLKSCLNVTAKLFAVPMTAAEARVDRALVLRVLLRDRLLEDLLQRHAEALQRVRNNAHEMATTSAAVITAFTVATGSSTFQPNRISWS